MKFFCGIDTEASELMDLNESGEDEENENTGETSKLVEEVSRRRRREVAWWWKIDEKTRASGSAS